MRTVYKYEIELHTLNDEDMVCILMPSCASPLSVGIQGQALVLWAIVDPARALAPYRVWVHGTGRVIHAPAHTQFLGTVQTPSGLVWHVFIER
jgi:hypothetical protein